MANKTKTIFFSLSILSSYVEAVDFSRFRFHRKRTASASLILYEYRLLAKKGIKVALKKLITKSGKDRLEIGC